MKDRLIQLPKLEKNKNQESKIMEYAIKPITSTELAKKIKGKSIRSLISNMVRDGKLEIVFCPHCNIGRMYKVK